MVRVKISDIEVSETRGYIYCKSQNGFTYRFSTSYEKAKLISLLMHGVYVPSNNIYEIFIRFLEEAGLNLHSVVILDGYKNISTINVTDGSTTKSFPIAIDDAIIIGLLTQTSIFIRKEACFLDIQELEKYVWYRFLKELDLC